MTITSNVAKADQPPGGFDAVMNIAPRPPIVFVSGQGSWLTDSTGRAYLDFIQGWAVDCLGHSPPAITRALARQAEQLINRSPAFYNDQMIRLSELLVQHSGSHQVFLANSAPRAPSTHAPRPIKSEVPNCRHERRPTVLGWFARTALRVMAWAVPTVDRPAVPYYVPAAKPRTT